MPPTFRLDPLLSRGAILDQAIFLGIASLKGGLFNYGLDASKEIRDEYGFATF